MQNKKTKNGREQLTEHHRKPRSMGGENTAGNISIVKRKYHEAYHLLFGNHNPEEVAKYLNEVWIDPQYEFIVQKRS